LTKFIIKQKKGGYPHERCYESSFNDSPNNGFFEIQYKEDGVYLTVHPPIGKGKAVEVNDVISRLTQKKIVYDKEMVELAVQRASNVPVKLANLRRNLNLMRQ